MNRLVVLLMLGTASGLLADVSPIGGCSCGRDDGPPPDDGNRPADTDTDTDTDTESGTNATDGG